MNIGDTISKIKYEKALKDAFLGMSDPLSSKGMKKLATLVPAATAGMGLVNLNNQKKQVNQDKVELSSAISEEEMSEMYAKNGYKKTKRGNVYKIPSPKQFFSIVSSFGLINYGGYILTKMLAPMNKEKQKDFQNFIGAGNNKEIAKENFDKMYMLFNMLYSDGSLNTINKVLKNNPDNSQVLHNFVKKPPYTFVFDAIQNYKGSLYSSINNKMRDDKYFLEDFYTQECVRRNIRDISAYIDEQVIEKPITLYRGEIVNGLFKNVKLEDGSDFNLTELMKKGNVNAVREFILDHEVTTKQPSFMSTSMDKYCAKLFVKEKYIPGERLQGLFEITTAPNTKGAFLEYASKMNESEVLLQKDSVLKLKDINFNEKENLWEIKAEVSN